MNIFEGSRRIAKLIGALIAVGTFIGLCAERAPVRLLYKALPFGQIILDANDDCRVGIDGFDGDDFTTAKGNKFHRTFCFVAMRADNGELLVPYKAEGTSMLLDQPYSTAVKAHMSNFLLSHPPTKADLERADDESRAQFIKHWSYGIGALLAGLMFYWIFVLAIGWVVRGFLGIPRGQDYKVHPVAQ